mgnify:FL=1
MKGLINRVILQGVKKGKKVHVIRRYLAIHHNIKVGHRVMLTRYGNIKRRYCSTL